MQRSVGTWLGGDLELRLATRLAEELATTTVPSGAVAYVRLEAQDADTLTLRVVRRDEAGDLVVAYDRQTRAVRVLPP
jgi:hypothetical protein